MANSKNIYRQKQYVHKLNKFRIQKSNHEFSDRKKEKKGDRFYMMSSRVKGAADRGKIGIMEINGGPSNAVDLGVGIDELIFSQGKRKGQPLDQSRLPARLKD